MLRGTPPDITGQFVPGIFVLAGATGAGFEGAGAGLELFPPLPQPTDKASKVKRKNFMVFLLSAVGFMGPLG